MTILSTDDRKAEALAAIKDAILEWQGRALNGDTMGCCPLCNFADDDCAVCPYEIAYKKACTRFEGYKIWVKWIEEGASYDESKEERKEGARLCVARLRELYTIWLEDTGALEEKLWRER